jgi:hypothetical protein
MLHSLLVLAACSPLAVPPQELIEAETKPAMVTPMDQYAALKAEYDKAMQAFWKDYQAQPEDARATFYEERPSPDDHAGAFLELAAAHPKTEAAASCYLWVAQYSDESEKSVAALDALILDHIDSPSMAQACAMLMRKYDVGEQYLTDILEQSSNPEVQGNACFYLGKHYMSCTDLVATLSMANEEQREAYVGYLGSEEIVERVAAMDPAELQQEAEECFERVCVEYADVEYRRGTLSEAAESNLFQIRNLQIGMVAPDIEGEDIFGTSFKISDYRGKVVVLDFWGNW